MAARDGDIAGAIAAGASPLPDPDDPGFGAALDAPLEALGAARVVLLGEASHGTSEFYRARSAITRHLVERHGFTALAVEADWPDAAQVDARIRGGRRPSQADGPPFRRFPAWMWRNAETADLLGWLGARNAAEPDPARRVGFFGLDLYSLGASIAAVLDYLDRTDPETAREARRRYACMEPWQRRPEVYGHATAAAGFGRCEAEVTKVLRAMLERRLDRAAPDGAAPDGAAPDGAEDGTEFFDAAQNARVVAAAERYYRSMYSSDELSWNLRDTHMADTLDAILARREGTKAVVWAHNSHVGDAAETDMRSRGELSLGQLCRERHGPGCALVGLGTHAGTVAAATDWDGPMEVKRVLPSRPDAVERLFHDAARVAGAGRLWLDLRRAGPDLRAALSEPRLQRFIGVVYRPETERWSHYFDARLARQYDHYLFFDETRALTPLPGPEERGGPDDTYPTGL